MLVECMNVDDDTFEMDGHLESREVSSLSGKWSKSGQSGALRSGLFSWSTY